MGTGNGLLTSRQGQCMCIYVIWRTVYAKANQEKLENVKRGAIEEKEYEGNLATYCTAVVTDVGLKFGVRGQSQVNGEGTGGVSSSKALASATSAGSGISTVSTSIS